MLLGNLSFRGPTWRQKPVRAWCKNSKRIIEGVERKIALPETNILLMVQKSGVHQLSLVVYPIIYMVSLILGGAGFLPSTVAPENSWLLQMKFLLELVPKFRGVCCSFQGVYTAEIFCPEKNVLEYPLT